MHMALAQAGWRNTNKSRILPQFLDRSATQITHARLQTTNKLEDDPLLNDYIESLGDKLVTRNKSVGGAFDFFLVRDPTINAFAGPGGHIGVNTGLILETETESELAAVLAHETAHVSQRHIGRNVKLDPNASSENRRTPERQPGMCIGAGVRAVRLAGTLCIVNDEPGLPRRAKRIEAQT